MIELTTLISHCLTFLGHRHAGFYRAQLCHCRNDCVPTSLFNLLRSIISVAHDHCLIQHPSKAPATCYTFHAKTKTACGPTYFILAYSIRPILWYASFKQAYCALFLHSGALSYSVNLFISMNEKIFRKDFLLITDLFLFHFSFMIYSGQSLYVILHLAHYCEN